MQHSFRNISDGSAMEIESTDEATVTERTGNVEPIDAFVDFVLGGNEEKEVIGFIVTMIRGEMPVSFKNEVQRGAALRIGNVTHSAEFDYIAVSRSGDFSNCAGKQAFSVYWDQVRNTLYVID